MGNTCCDNAANKDKHAKDFNGKAGKPEARDPNLDKLL
jgi:IQ calmodulin-binding motif